jgi:hypothetical protein
MQLYEVFYKIVNQTSKDCIMMSVRAIDAGEACRIVSNEVSNCTIEYVHPVIDKNVNLG